MILSKMQKENQQNSKKQIPMETRGRYGGWQFLVPWRNLEGEFYNLTLNHHPINLN